MIDQKSNRIRYSRPLFGAGFLGIVVSLACVWPRAAEAFEATIPVPVSIVQAIGEEWLPILTQIDDSTMHVSDPTVRFAEPGRLAVDTVVVIDGVSGRLTLSTTHIRVTATPGVFVFEDLAVEIWGLDEPRSRRIEQILQTYARTPLVAITPDSMAFPLAGMLKRLQLGDESIIATVAL